MHKPTIRQPHNPTSERPFLVIWEVTQACDLACKHCRAQATPNRQPMELSLSEGKMLIDQVADFGKPLPLLVFTGGDPFKREDLAQLVSYAASLGFKPAVSPSGTPLLTSLALGEIKQAGASAISLSIDGHNSQVHDSFRGVDGSFDLTVRGCQAAKDNGLKLQINSTISRHNIDTLADLAKLVMDLNVMTWSVFFLVPTGRAQFDQALTPTELEAVLHFLVDISSFIPVKTTEGHHYKRALLMRQVLDTLERTPQMLQLDPLYARLSDRWLQLCDAQPGPTTKRSPMHINSAQGFVFIGHLGEVFPSGFLPISAGNVRKKPLREIYRNSPLFQALRNGDLLHGRCGACEFKNVCGGSRSRAYACTGDVLSDDPACAYEPGSFPFQAELTLAMAGRKP